jgi:hypothetical protein
MIRNYLPLNGEALTSLAATSVELDGTLGIHRR